MIPTLKRLWRYCLLLIWRQEESDGQAQPTQQPIAAPVTESAPSAAESIAPSPAPRKINEQRQRLRGIVRARREIADIINDIIDRMAQIDMRSNSERSLAGRNEVPALENLLGCDFLLMNSAVEHEALIPGGKFTAFSPESDGNAEDLVEICWPIDQGTVVQKDYGYLLSRLETIDAKEARGKAQLFASKMVRLTNLHLGNGRWDADTIYAGWINNRWVPLDRKMESEQNRGGKTIVRANRHTRALSEDLHLSTTMLLSLALTRRYSWHVSLGVNPNGMRVMIPTNPRGCLAFFKNRERTESLARRAALRHWVRKHYRDNSESGLAFVREHLRGHTEFRWCDLGCEIFVSEYDLEKNEEFKREAEHWRATRKHNRVRVHLKQRTAQRSA